MLVRFGYVAMSMTVKNASPSKTMTATAFGKIADREAAVRKLERIAEENLQNTLRLLKHNRYMDVKVYRFSSKLVPLWSHEWLADWDPIPLLTPHFTEIGAFVEEHGMRVSFHPDHFTVLSTPRQEVLRKSAEDLDFHVRMLEAMGLDERAKCNIHVGGTYGDKEKAGERFLRQFGELSERIVRRMTLENDDKTFTASETLAICEQAGVPMVLDLHHHDVNNGGESAADLWPRIKGTWERHGGFGIEELPPKIHISSPKSDKEIRSHADYVEADRLYAFLKEIAADTPRLDVMIEAKMKDEALARLMGDFRRKEERGEPLRIVDGASLEIMG